MGIDNPNVTELASCRFDACATLGVNQENLATKVLDGGRYAVYSHVGTYSDSKIAETCTKIFTEILQPESPIQLDRNRLTFCQYINYSFISGSQSKAFKIYVPILA